METHIPAVGLKLDLIFSFLRKSFSLVMVNKMLFVHCVFHLTDMLPFTESISPPQ
jgi:hypothetical protein